MGRILQELRHGRDGLYLEQLTKGITDLRSMARALLVAHPNEMSRNADLVVADIKRFLSRTGRPIPPSAPRVKAEKKTRPTSAPKRRTRQEATLVGSRFDSLINSAPIKLTLNESRRVERLFKLIRSAWITLELEAGRAAFLEREIKDLRIRLEDWERHQCSDVNAEAREEIQRLQEALIKLELRNAALSKMSTHRTLSSEHLVICSDK